MRRPPFLLALSALTLAIGCAPVGGGSDGDPDSDGDLLTDEFEISIGTDPDLADTDGDGFTDAEEHFTYFSPRNIEDFPYTGRYPRGPLWRGSSWDEITEESGWGQGDVSNSWTHVDRFGEELKLKRFYGQVVLIDLSAEWCPPCRAAAETLDEEYTTRKEDGFVVIQIMLDGLTYTEEPNLDRWADEFGLTNPLVADHPGDVARHYIPAGDVGIPNYTIIGRDHVIESWYQAGGTANFGLVDGLLEDERPEVDYPWPEDADAIRDELGIAGPDSWVHPFDVPR